MAKLSKGAVVAMACLGLLATGGCQTAGAGGAFPDLHAMLGPQGDDADPALKKKVDDFGQTVVEGAVIGAVIGGVVGYAATGSARGAAIGAGLGGGAGAAAGVAIANMKKDYASQQDALDAEVAEARAKNAELVDLVATARSALDTDRQRLADLQAEVTKGTGRIEDYMAAQRKVVANRDQIAAAIKIVDDRADTVGKRIEALSGEGADPAALVKEKDTLGRSRKDLVTIRESYDALLLMGGVNA